MVKAHLCSGPELTRENRRGGNGILVMMFYQDHHPAHFHAKYEGQVGVYGIKGCRLLAGKLPPRASRLIKEWARGHEKELMDDWRIARNDGKLKMIEPLL